MVLTMTDSTRNVPFGRELRRLRGSRSAAQVAKAIGLGNEESYRRYERGLVPRLERLRQLEVALEAPAGTLTGYVGVVPSDEGPRTVSIEAAVATSDLDERAKRVVLAVVRALREPLTQSDLPARPTERLRSRLDGGAGAAAGRRGPGEDPRPASSAGTT